MHRARLSIISAIIFVAISIVPYLQAGQAQDSAQQMNISESQMRSFAKVYVEFEKIRESYAPQMKEAKDSEEAKAIEKDAVSKMHEVLSQEGLTEESYVQIFEMARTEEDLRQKLIELIKAEVQKP